MILTTARSFKIASASPGKRKGLFFFLTSIYFIGRRGGRIVRFWSSQVGIVLGGSRSGMLPGVAAPSAPTEQPSTGTDLRSPAPTSGSRMLRSPFQRSRTLTLG